MTDVRLLRPYVVLSAVPTAVLSSATFKTLSETKMSAAVAAAMDYITKRGCGMMSPVLLAFCSFQKFFQK